MGYRKDEIEQLKASLAELPQLENVEVSKREAVRLLASTIHGLHGKGYRLDKIAELVSERGVTIKPTTLKSYLHRVKPRGKVGGEDESDAGGCRGGGNDGAGQKKPG